MIVIDLSAIFGWMGQICKRMFRGKARRLIQVSHFYRMLNRSDPLLTVANIYTLCARQHKKIFRFFLSAICTIVTVENQFELISAGRALVRLLEISFVCPVSYVAYIPRVYHMTLRVVGFHYFGALVKKSALATNPPAAMSALRFNIACFMRDLSWPPALTPCTLRSQLSMTRSQGLFDDLSSSLRVMNCDSIDWLFCLRN